MNTVHRTVMTPIVSHMPCRVAPPKMYHCEKYWAKTHHHFYSFVLCEEQNSNKILSPNHILFVFQRINLLFSRNTVLFHAIGEQIHTAGSKESPCCLVKIFKKCSLPVSKGQQESRVVWDVWQFLAFMRKLETWKLGPHVTMKRTVQRAPLFLQTEELGLFIKLALPASSCLRL